MNPEPYAEFVGTCRKIGWKCTAQRLAVYNFLQGNTTHPDVDAVWTAVRQNLPTVTRESVYRILNEFAEQGLIGRLDHLYCARYDPCVKAHGHFICEKCGEILDFVWPTGAAVPPLPGEIHHTEMRVTGICERCVQAAL